jgi:hypothetical protein
VAVYVVVFLLTLGITSGCQYLFNSYIDRNVDSTSTNSFIIVSVFIVQGICLASVCLGIYLTDSRFGSDGILGVGSI